LILYQCDSNNEKDKAFRNCILSFNFFIPDTPNPTGFGSKIYIEDPILDSLLSNYYRIEPTIMFQNKIFSDSTLRYKIVKVFNDSGHYYWVSAWLNIYDGDYLTVENCDSLSKRTFEDLQIIIQKDTLKWTIYQCIK